MVTFYNYLGSFQIFDKVYVLNGESVTLDIDPVVLQPATIGITFNYESDYLIDDGTGVFIVDSGGFPNYIVFNPTILAYTMIPDNTMQAGDIHSIQVKAICQL